MSKRKATEPALLTACPLTGLPINDKLPKKLKSSSQVNKKTILNVMTNRLGWTPRPQSDQWDDDTWMQEYYAQLMQKKYVDEHPQQVTTPPPPQQYPRMEDQSRTAPARPSPTASLPIRNSPSSPRVAELRNRKRNDAPAPAQGVSKSPDKPIGGPEERESHGSKGGSICATLVKLICLLMIGGVVVTVVLHSDKGMVELIGGRASESLVKKVPTLEYLLEAWNSLSKVLTDLFVRIAGNINRFLSHGSSNSSVQSLDALQIVKDANDKPENLRKVTIKESKPVDEALKIEKSASSSKHDASAPEGKAANRLQEDGLQGAKASKKKKAKKLNLEEGAPHAQNSQDRTIHSEEVATPKADSPPREVNCEEFSLYDCRAGQGDYEGWSDEDCTLQKSKCVKNADS